MENIESKIALFKKLRDFYYEIPGNNVGGKLHIVLDDYNYDDSSIEYCYKLCDADEKGREICELLSSIPFERRLYMDMPSWQEEYFDYEYTEVGGEIEPGDFVKTLVEDSEIFVAGDVLPNLVTIHDNISLGYPKNKCVKIKLTQELNF